MTWPHQSERGDPLKVLARRQELPPARTCVGCKEIRVITNSFDGRRVLRYALTRRSTNVVRSTRCGPAP